MLILIFAAMNLTAFCPYSEAIFNLVKKRLISDGNALRPLALANNLCFFFNSSYTIFDVIASVHREIWGSPIKGLVKRKNTPSFKKNLFFD